MENIVVGLIVGATLTSSIYIWKNKDFSITQKVILLLFFIFPPLQWLGILLVLWYNRYEKENTSEFKEEKKLSTSIDDLKDLKQKGILTDEEFSAKIKKVEQDSLEHKLKNSPEYKQLKNLLDSGILTEAEFKDKINEISQTIDLSKESLKESLIGIYKVQNKTFNFLADNTLLIHNLHNQNTSFWEWDIIDAKSILIKNNSYSTTFENVELRGNKIYYKNGSTFFEGSLIKQT